MRGGFINCFRKLEKNKQVVCSRRNINLGISSGFLVGVNTIVRGTSTVIENKIYMQIYIYSGQHSRNPLRVMNSVEVGQEYMDNISVGAFLVSAHIVPKQRGKPQKRNSRGRGTWRRRVLSTVLGCCGRSTMPLNTQNVPLKLIYPTISVHKPPSTREDEMVSSPHPQTCSQRAVILQFQIVAGGYVPEYVRGITYNVCTLPYWVMNPSPSPSPGKESLHFPPQTCARGGVIHCTCQLLYYIHQSTVLLNVKFPLRRIFYSWTHQ